MRFRPTVFDIICNILCLVLLIGSGVWIILQWGDMPAQIPTHFDFAGNPNAYGSKMTIWGLYAVGWVIWLIIFICSFFPRTWSIGVKVAPQNLGRAYAITFHFMHIINLLCVALLTYCLIAAITTAHAITAIFWGLLALVFIATAVMIFMLFRLR